MSAKTCRFFTQATVIALAAFIAWSVIMEMPVFLPVAGVVVALLLIRLFRRFTKQIMVDERLHRINEKAAAISYRIFSIVMAVTGVALITLRHSLPDTFSIVGETLAYSVCVFMLIHLVFYYYYGRKL